MEITITRDCEYFIFEWVTCRALIRIDNPELYYRNSTVAAIYVLAETANALPSINGEVISINIRSADIIVMRDKETTYDNAIFNSTKLALVYIILKSYIQPGNEIL